MEKSDGSFFFPSLKASVPMSRRYRDIRLGGKRQNPFTQIANNSSSGDVTRWNPQSRLKLLIFAAIGFIRA